MRVSTLEVGLILVVISQHHHVCRIVKDIGGMDRNPNSKTLRSGLLLGKY